jgi:hypothetical protein
MFVCSSVGAREKHGLYTATVLPYAEMVEVSSCVFDLISASQFSVCTENPIRID